MESLSREEKERLLRALESDREFRYALMGLLGFREVLERQQRLEERFARLEERQQRLEEEFKKLEERQQRLEERFAELEERFARLEERVARLEERFADLEERFARLEERFAELEERQQKLEERVARLEERFAELEERFARLEERFLALEERAAKLEERMLKIEQILDQHSKAISELMRSVRRLEATVGALGRRFGKGFEALLRGAFKELLEGLGLREYDVQRFRYVDVDGRYLAPGTVIEVDVVVRDGQLWLLELKSTVGEEDVAWFHAVSRVAERIMGRRADRRLILGVVVDREAYDYAKKLGIDVVYVNLVEA